MNKSVARGIRLGGLVLLASGIFLFLFFQISGQMKGDFVHVSVDFDNAGGLIKQSDIKLSGVIVGYVSRIEVVHHRARIHLMIDRAYGIKTDATAAIRSKSILGEKFLELTQPFDSTARELKDTDVIQTVLPSASIEDLVTFAGAIFSEIEPSAVNGFVKSLRRLADIDLNEINSVISDGRNAIRSLTNASNKLIHVLDALEKSEPEKLVMSLRSTVDDFQPMITHLNSLVAKLETSNLEKDIKDVVITLNNSLKNVPEDMAAVRLAVKKFTHILGNVEKIDKAAVMEIIDGLKEAIQKDGIRIRLF